MLPLPLREGGGKGLAAYKYGPTKAQPTPHWYDFSSHATVSGNTITLTLTDGADGDSDLSANGSISDPGGPVLPGDVSAIPTLSQWALLLLSLLAAALGMRAVRRRY